MSVEQVVTIVCPECGTESEALIQDIINGQDLIVKAAFLEERLNDVSCAKCHTNITPTVPMLYYDLEKELAFVLAPAEASPTGATLDETIGILVNSLINSLPATQRKAYFFTPQRFATLKDISKAVLAADNLTEETILHQAEKAQLLETFLYAPDEATFQQNVQRHDAELNYEFFELLTGYMHAAQLAENTTRAQTLFALREHLGKVSTQGQEAIAQIDAQLNAAVAQRQQELIEQLKAARNNEDRQKLIADNYSALDYAFFQQMTAQIDEYEQAHDHVTANTLKALQSNIIFLKTEYDKKAQAAIEKGEDLFKEILQSDKPDQVMKENLARIDESFFFVLGANIERARQQDQEEPAQALEKIGQAAVALLQEQQS